MEKILKRVTVTGADDETFPIKLFELQEEFPFVEWGILISKSSMGGFRFPSLKWLQELNEMCESPLLDILNLSCHICGKWTRDICFGEINDFKDYFEFILPHFKRVQLNFHAITHKIEEEKFIKNLKDPCFGNVQFVFQFDDVNNELINIAIKNGIPAVPLFDISGGTGVLPEEWPKGSEMYCGYAGGLSPDNLEEQYKKIYEVVNKEYYLWIDAETRLRTSDNSILDLNKVEKFLEISKKWAITGQDK